MIYNVNLHTHDLMISILEQLYIDKDKALLIVKSFDGPFNVVLEIIELY